MFEPNLGEAVQAIRLGTLDLMLMKPIDGQLLVSLRRFHPPSSWDFVSGVLLAIGASTRIAAPSALDVALAGVLFVSGVLAMYGLWLFAICASFLFVRVDNLRFLLWSVSDAGRWPISVFRGAARFVLTALVPVALVTSFPVEALRGAWSFTTVGVATAVSLGFVILSRWAWNRSLALYTSASS